MKGIRCALQGRLGRYEVHFDRKLERTLNTLMRLQGLRRTTDPG
jgi:hypothetical protein